MAELDNPNALPAGSVLLEYRIKALMSADGFGITYLADDTVLSLRFEESAVVVQTARPDAFYGRLTDLAASGEFGAIHEVTSPDDNLQAVFQYLVK